MNDEASFFGIEVPLMRLLGLQTVHLDETVARTRLPQKPEILNSHGHTHGGTLMAVLDFTMSAAARAHDPHGFGVITIDMTTHFLAPGQGELTFEATTTRRGKSIVFCEGSAYDSTGQQVCTARGVFKLVPRKKEN
jgi:uncharacterized protein (TIGR00369 family)